MHLGAYGRGHASPLMAALLLVMCFPLKGVIVMLAAAAIGAAHPPPKA